MTGKIEKVTYLEKVKFVENRFKELKNLLEYMNKIVFNRNNYNYELDIKFIEYAKEGLIGKEEFLKKTDELMYEINKKIVSLDEDIEKVNQYYDESKNNLLDIMDKEILDSLKNDIKKGE